MHPNPKRTGFCLSGCPERRPVQFAVPTLRQSLFYQHLVHQSIPDCSWSFWTGFGWRFEFHYLCQWLGLACYSEPAVPNLVRIFSGHHKFLPDSVRLPADCPVLPSRLSWSLPFSSSTSGTAFSHLHLHGRTSSASNVPRIHRHPAFYLPAFRHRSKPCPHPVRCKQSLLFCRCPLRTAADWFAVPNPERQFPWKRRPFQTAAESSRSPAPAMHTASAPAESFDSGEKSPYHLHFEWLPTIFLSISVHSWFIPPCIKTDADFLQSVIQSNFFLLVVWL